MDVIITAVGEFIWASSCAVVNFCLSSGLSAMVIFVSFLCGILASTFYKYTSSREHMLLNNTNKSATANLSASTSSFIEMMDVNENEKNNGYTSNDNITDFNEDSEEEIQTKQIKDVYHLLNDNDLTVGDFLDQLKMYGLQIHERAELALC